MQTYTAFADHNLLSHGPIDDVALAVRAWSLDGTGARLAIYDDRTGAPVDLDLRGGPRDVLARLDGFPNGPSTVQTKRGPGRPKLGVVSREVSLLPRHWHWLKTQPRSASATLRSLVEEAMKSGADNDDRRRASNTAYAVMSDLAGDLPGFEEASRALFAGDREALREQVAPWSQDLRDYIERLLGKKDH